MLRVNTLNRLVVEVTMDMFELSLNQMKIRVLNLLTKLWEEEFLRSTLSPLGRG